MNLSDAHFANLRQTLASETPLEGILVADRYRVERRIARGGMGEVFYAIDTLLDRPVALKTLASVVESDQGRERLALEVSALTQLDHPGIVPIHDLGTLADGRLFFSMKYVEGKTLRERMAERPGALLEQDSAQDLAQELLAALATAADIVHFAHERGVVHRDLKPANVMIDHRGHVFVLDWGVAKLVRGEDGGDRSVGTVGYMAPESRTGEGTIDARSDVWALGAILREIVDGMPPGAVPEALDRVVGSAMANDPAQRHPTAALFAADLRRAIRKRPTRRFVLGAIVAAAVLAASLWALSAAGGIGGTDQLSAEMAAAAREKGLRRAHDVRQRIRATTREAMRALLLRLAGDTVIPLGVIRADELTHRGLAERTRALDELRGSADALPRAVSAWLRGQLEEALRLLDAGSFAGPERARAEEWAGWILLQLGRSGEAEQRFASGLRLHPAHVPLAHGLAAAQMARQLRSRGTAPPSFEPAIRTLDRAVALEALRSQSLALRGDLHLRSQRHSPDKDRAIADFDAAIRITDDPDVRRDRGDAFLSRALARLANGNEEDPRADFATAAADYQQTRKMGAGGPMILLRVAAVSYHRAEWRSSRGEDAGEDYSHALTLYRTLVQRAPVWGGLLRSVIARCRRQIGR